jgi:hypothetical protein
LTIIKRTYTSIGIVGRPWEMASLGQCAAIGCVSAASRSSTSNAARSSGSSRTSPGSTSSHNDSTCPPDNSSISNPLDQKPAHLQDQFS